MMQITLLILKIYFSIAQLRPKKQRSSRSAEEPEFEISATNQLAKRRAAYNKGFFLRKKHFWVPHPQ